MFERVFDGEGFFAIWGLFQPFATVPTSCLVVSQHEDTAVFHDIAVDIVVRGLVVPDSSVSGISPPLSLIAAPGC